VFVPETGEKGASRKRLLYSGGYYASAVLKIGTGKRLCNDTNFKTGSGCTCLHVVVLLADVSGTRSRLVDKFRQFLWTIGAK